MHFALCKALGLMESTIEERMAGLKELEEATPAGSARRAALKKAHDDLYDESGALGAEMNQAYDLEAVYRHDETGSSPVWPEGSPGVQQHVVSTYPGSRLPHAWLGTARFGEKFSTHDLAGKGAFTLFTDIEGAETWTAAAKVAIHALGGNVPIVVRIIGHGQEFMDLYYAWEDRRGIEAGGLSWRGRTGLWLGAARLFPGPIWERSLRL